MKKIFLIVSCVFLGTACAVADEKDDLISSLIRFISSAEYKGINHDGVYTMTAENVVIYSNELDQYEPFKSFENQITSTYYILNKASIAAGLTPVYSIDNETDPEKWPAERTMGNVVADKNADGYRRAGTKGFTSTIDTITYIDAEEQRKFNERAADEKSAGEKRLAELLETFISKLKNVDYDLYWDSLRNKEYMISKTLVEIYSREFNNLLPPSFKTDAALKYVLNKASVAHGLEPVYNVNKETAPEKWNLPRYREIKESASANGYRLAETYHKKAAGIENTATSYSIIRFDNADTLKIKEGKAAAGKAYLESIGLNVSVNDNQVMKLSDKADKSFGIITTDEKDYKIFSFTTSGKKSAAAKSGFKDGDLFVIANGTAKNGKSTSHITTIIKLDSKVINLSSYGGNATIDDLYAAFEKAADAKNVSIQIIRASKTSTTYKEFQIKK